MPRTKPPGLPEETGVTMDLWDAPMCTGSIVFKELLHEGVDYPDLLCLYLTYMAREIWLCSPDVVVYIPDADVRKSLYGWTDERFNRRKARLVELKFLDEQAGGTYPIPYYGRSKDE